MIIKKGDIVIHLLSKLHFTCENSKMARWMNMNPYYKLACSSKVEHLSDTQEAEISKFSEPTRGLAKCKDC